MRTLPAVALGSSSQCTGCWSDLPLTTLVSGSQLSAAHGDDAQEAQPSDMEKNTSLVQGSGVSEQGKAAGRGRRLRVPAKFFTLGEESSYLSANL